MCDLGLVRIDSKDGSKGFIVKTDAFYKAQRLGIGAWIRQNENDTKRERKKIKHDARGSWAKANFWWVSLAAIALSLWALVRSYLG